MTRTGLRRASLQERNGSYRLLFCYHGRQYTWTPGKVGKGETGNKARQVDSLLLRLGQRLTVPWPVAGRENTYIDITFPTAGVPKTMRVKKRKMALAVLLTVTTISLGTAVIPCRTRAADPGGHRVVTDLPPLTHVIDYESRLPPEAARLHAYVSKPLAPAETAYRQIPWLVDLNEGLRVARDEKRPLLLWTSGDDPLDRC